MSEKESGEGKEGIGKGSGREVKKKETVEGMELRTNLQFTPLP